jgi:sarcosine oxidase
MIAVNGSRAKNPMKRYDVIVVGAGVFGSWTAWHLLRQGRKVLLLDAFGPAHVRASSGGETRMLRTAYGPDEIYTRLAWSSIDDWRWLSERTGTPIFHPIGVVFFFPRVEPYVTQSVELHRRLGIPFQTLDRVALARRFPQVVWDGVEIAIFEPDRGALMARRAVQALAQEFQAAGGEYRQLAVLPPSTGTTLDAISAPNGETLHADRFVFACGPWLPKLFPDLLGGRIFTTRQEVFYFERPAGDARFAPAQMPAWADFNGGDIYYGMPDFEARGFKVAHDAHGPSFDPDTGDRQASAAGLAEVRRYMERRFPSMARQPLSATHVCQYENSSNGDLLIDRHPSCENVWLVGAGSGHGFKHGPAVGRYASALVLGNQQPIEPRLSLQSKGKEQKRDVH